FLWYRSKRQPVLAWWRGARRRYRGYTFNFNAGKEQDCSFHSGPPQFADKNDSASVRQSRTHHLTYFSFITAIVALGTEVLVFLSLMEMPPIGKGGSDIIWALPFFGLVVFALAAFGFLAALRARGSPTPARNLSNCRGFAKRSQPPNSNCDARFSSWSSH